MNPVEAAPTTTRFGRLNARKKHNLPYIETIHIQPGREERFIIVAWKMLESFLKKGCSRYYNIQSTEIERATAGS